jgi:hypothetical protein
MHSDEMLEHSVRTGEALTGRMDFLPNPHLRDHRAIEQP